MNESLKVDSWVDKRASAMAAEMVVLMVEY